MGQTTRQQCQCGHTNNWALAGVAQGVALVIVLFSLAPSPSEAAWIRDGRCDYINTCNTGGNCYGRLTTYWDGCPSGQREFNRWQEEDCIWTDCTLGTSCPSGRSYSGCDCSDCLLCGGLVDRNCNNGGRSKNQCCKIRDRVQCAVSYSCTYIAEGRCGPIAPDGVDSETFTSNGYSTTTCNTANNRASCPSGETQCGCDSGGISVNGVTYGRACCCWTRRSPPPPPPSPPPPPPPSRPPPPPPDPPPYDSPRSSGAILSADNVQQPRSSSGSGGGGISGGAVAGIVIAILAAVIALAAGGFFVYRRRRAAAESPPTASAAAGSAGSGHTDGAGKQQQPFHNAIAKARTAMAGLGDKLRDMPPGASPKAGQGEVGSNAPCAEKGCTDCNSGGSEAPAGAVGGTTAGAAAAVAGGAVTWSSRVSGLQSRFAAMGEQFRGSMMRAAGKGGATAAGSVTAQAPGFGAQPQPITSPPAAQPLYGGQPMADMPQQQYQQQASVPGGGNPLFPQMPMQQQNVPPAAGGNPLYPQVPMQQQLAVPYGGNPLFPQPGPQQPQPQAQMVMQMMPDGTHQPVMVMPGSDGGMLMPAPVPVQPQQQQ